MALGPDKKQFCSEFYVWFCRLWGIATALVLWGIGIEIAFDKEIVGYYIIFVAAVMSALETVFLMHLLVKECQGDTSETCLSCWSYVLAVDDWKKSLIYVLFSIFCLIRNFLLKGEAWLSIIAGTMLLLSAVFYFFKSFTKSRLYLPTEVNNQCSNQNTYSRVDRAGEELGSGGSITNDVSSHMPDSISIHSTSALISNGQDRSMAEQSEIMEA